MAFIQCEGLVRIYKTADLEVFALQGLDLTVEQGEMMAIIGNSGSGKSTLLNVLGGLDLPTAGRCSVAGMDLLRLSAIDRVRYQREVVGFVWQNNARNLIPYLTALDNVQLPMALAGRTGSKARAWALELLDAVGLTGRTQHHLTALSGGEQQRVAIALALANRPGLLLADEPTGSVDTATASQMLGIFREVNQRFGTTVVIVTHDRALARAVDRYVLIRDGKVSQEAVRKTAAQIAEMARSAPDGASPEEVHEELVVLDGAGRLQIPRELLEKAGLNGRAKVDLVNDVIQIRKP